MGFIGDVTNGLKITIDEKKKERAEKKELEAKEKAEFKTLEDAEYQKALKSEMKKKAKEKGVARAKDRVHGKPQPQPRNPQAGKPLGVDGTPLNPMDINVFEVTRKLSGGGPPQNKTKVPVEEQNEG